MPIDPATGQWTDVEPQAPQAPPSSGGYSPQSAMDSVALGQYLSQVDPRFTRRGGMVPQTTPNPGIKIGHHQIVSGHTMDTLLPYLAAMTQTLGAPSNEPYSNRGAAIFNVAKGLMGGYIGSQQTRIANNKLAEKNALELQKERDTQAGSFGRGLAQHRWRMQEKAVPTPGQNEGYLTLDTPQKEAAFRQQFPKLPVPLDKIIPRSAMFPTPKEVKPDLNPADYDLTETNAFGHKFLNLGKLVGQGPDVRKAAMTAARLGKATVVTAAQADALGNVDTSELNIKDLEAAIDGVLPRDPAGRLIVGPENKLSQFFQTNDDLASWGTTRNQAIQFLRTAAGSKGLRINEAEILMAAANDVPKITDTYAVGMKKLAKIHKQITRVEQSILARDRSALMQQNDSEKQGEAEAVRKAVLGQ